MAANYWASTQRRFWCLTRDKLAEIRDELEEQNSAIIQQYPMPDRRLVFIFIKEKLLQLAKRLAFRQQAVATALVYIHRYFLAAPIQSTNVFLLVATAFYLASKTEEAPHHIRLVSQEARQAWIEFIPGDMASIGEMEFALISEMRSQLIVWHPYRTLIDLKDKPEIGLSPEEVALASSIINDSYMTDLPLTCSPHVIAVTAIFLAVVFQPTRATLGLHSLPQMPPSSSDPSSFQSIGGQPGVAGSFSNALDSMSSSQPMSRPDSQSQNQNGSHRDLENLAAMKKKTLAAALASEKIQKLVRFLADSELDIKEIIEATQEIISLYVVWEEYNDKTVRESLCRCIRSRNLTV